MVLLEIAVGTVRDLDVTRAAQYALQRLVYPVEIYDCNTLRRVVQEAIMGVGIEPLLVTVSSLNGGDIKHKLRPSCPAHEALLIPNGILDPLKADRIFTLDEYFNELYENGGKDLIARIELA